MSDAFIAMSSIRSTYFSGLCDKIQKGNASELEVIDAIKDLCNDNERLAVLSRRKAAEIANTRAPASVQEAAKVLLGDDEACLRLAEAYDREDGAQRGDPSPHVLGRDEPDYAEWAQDRVGCAKAALRAIAEGGEA